MPQIQSFHDSEGYFWNIQEVVHISHGKVNERQGCYQFYSG